MSNVHKAPLFLPKPVDSAPSFEVAEGDIILLRDENWSSPQLELNIYNWKFPEGQDLSFAGTQLQDAATSIAYRLPKGVICTLIDQFARQT